MKIENKNGIVFLYPDSGKKIKKKDGSDLYGCVALAIGDVQSNYEEVDELWYPDEPEEEKIQEDETLVLIPDENGKISYEDAQELLTRIGKMQSRICELTDMINEFVTQN